MALVDTAATLLRIAQLRRHDTWSRERLRRHQARMLAALLDHALARSPFYRRAYRAAGAGRDTPLAGLPPVDKTTIMANFDEVVTDPRLRLADLEAHLERVSGDELYLGTYRVIGTGGTSGVRGVLAYDRPAWALSVAGALRTGAFMDLRARRGRRLRVASVTTTDPVHWSARYAATAGLGVTASLHLDARTPTVRLVAALNRHRPDLLECYPSIAAALAREQLEGRLRIRPRAVATSGEPRTEHTLGLMRAAWGDALFDGYATTETGLAGMECTRHRGIHLLEDLTIFEVEDRRVLVTNLVNRTIPLVRYELSDMLTLAGDPCPCGRPWRLVTTIAGRSEDLLRLRTASGAPLEVHPTALTGPLERRAGLRAFRVVHDPGALVVAVVPAPGVDPAVLARDVAAELEGVLRGLGVVRCPVRVEPAARIDRVGAAGKAKLVEERAR
ncbi:MAG TPA: hypothetical protein VLB47_02110 [Solirubrobacteraceae bacterium]|nr:hypothetical protein [Solirubrobacteraceae bacterium]